MADGLAEVARLGGGALSDDPQRRRTVAVGGYTATAVLAAGTGAATSVWQVAVLRAGAWTARGLRVPARNALLADVVPPSAYGRAYGFERAMENLGAILGPLLAIVLVATSGTRPAIAISIIPGLLAALAIIYAIRHTAKPTTRDRVPIRLRVRPVLNAPCLGRLFAGLTAFEFGKLCCHPPDLAGHRSAHTGARNRLRRIIALWLYVAYNIAATVASLVAGHAADRRTSRLVLTVGAAAFALADLGSTRDTNNFIGLVPWFVLAGIGIGCVETAEHSAVAGLAPSNVRGSAFGLLAATQSFGNFTASVLTGIIWTALTPTWAFAYLAASMIIGTALLASTRPSSPIRARFPPQSARPTTPHSDADLTGIPPTREPSS